MGKGYYVGLDMGTGSVGWAVTDESYQIFRRHGKAMWGVRLFESAKTAEERRMFRTGRRRLDRRGWRIEILQEIFAEEISRVDPGFFLRMKESKYYPEDKRDIQGNCPELPYTLFVDKTFTDKDFHKKYPTIYHLRKMLMETEDTPDMRLVYLALHHMMKHRGHFLLSGDISQVTEFKNTFNQFIENIRNEEMDFEIELDESAVQMIEETLKDKNLTRSAKKAKLVKGLNAKNVRDKAFLTLLSGGTVKLSDVMELAGQVEGKEGRFVLSDNEKEVDISKNVELIFNIFALDINERKLISKLYMELEKLTADERFYVKTQEMKQYLQEYLLQLEQETDYILDLADEIDFASLFKAFGIKYEVLEENFLERLVRYMRIVERLLKKKLFVFVNLRSYLSNQQIDELIKEATYQEIQLLLIETCARDCIEGVTRYIIDKDGCEI